MTTKKTRGVASDSRRALRQAELQAEDAPDQSGVVSAVYAEKGYGWLRGADGVGRFFHADACDQDLYKLKPGTKLRFKPVEAPKGPRAIQVRIEGGGDDSYDSDDEDSRGNKR